MDELAKRIAELAEKVGPHAVDAARASVRVEVYSCMASAVMWLIVAAIILWGATRLWRHETEDPFDSEVPKIFGGVAYLIGGIALALSLWTFVDPWTWTAINNPDLYLAKKILKL